MNQPDITVNELFLLSQSQRQALLTTVKTNALSFKAGSVVQLASTKTIWHHEMAGIFWYSSDCLQGMGFAVQVDDVVKLQMSGMLG